MSDALTPEQRRDAVYERQALELVALGDIRMDQVDSYVAAMRGTLEGQSIALRFAVADLWEAFVDSLPEPLRRWLRP